MTRSYVRWEYAQAHRVHHCPRCCEDAVKPYRLCQGCSAVLQAQLFSERNRGMEREYGKTHKLILGVNEEL